MNTLPPTGSHVVSVAEPTPAAATPIGLPQATACQRACPPPPPAPPASCSAPGADARPTFPHPPAQQPQQQLHSTTIRSLLYTPLMLTYNSRGRSGNGTVCAAQEDMRWSSDTASSWSCWAVGRAALQAAAPHTAHCALPQPRCSLATSAPMNADHGCMRQGCLPAGAWMVRHRQPHLAHPHVHTPCVPCAKATR
jgi:hypothetical protein